MTDNTIESEVMLLNAKPILQPLVIGNDINSDDEIKKSVEIPSPVTEKRTNTFAHPHSPNKRIRLDLSPSKRTKKSASDYRFGNYDRYYGYRNSKDFKDIRLDAFKVNKELFQGKDILDIGCNNGLVTIAVARDFLAKAVTGLDIDKNLINRARQYMATEKKSCSSDLQTVTNETYPNNIIFKHGNYVLSDSTLLQLEKPQFDTILCLSVTKWIQLNFGDDGLKTTFKRMFKQLRDGGHLILEAQEWKSYKRRKKLNDTISKNYKNIKLMPNKFEEYLLSNEVGFERCYLLELGNHESAGFRRPIQVFVKAKSENC